MMICLGTLSIMDCLHFVMLSVREEDGIGVS